MKTSNKTFIINTYTEDKYRQLSASASDKQLHIVDNDDAHRTVVPSYDLLAEKVKLGLAYDNENMQICLRDADKNVISHIDAKPFISDNYLISAAYDDGKLVLSVQLSGGVNEIPVDFPVDQSLSPLNDYLSSSYPIASKAVASALIDLSDQVTVELLALSNSLTAEVERASAAEKELDESAALSVQNLSSELMPLINAAQETADLKTTDTLESVQGRSRIFNEYTGGGAKVEDKRGINSFVGVNLPNETSGAYGSLYVLSGSAGPRLKMFKEGFNYKKTGSNWYSFEEDAELATVKDIDDAFSNVSGTWTAAGCEIVDEIKQQDGQVSVIYKVLDVAGVSGLQDELNLKATKDEVALKVTDTLTSDWGKSRIFNEDDGGGAKVEDSKLDRWSFVGVNHPNDMSGSFGSLYVVSPTTKSGTRLKMFADGFNYKKATENWNYYEQSADLVTFNDLSSCISDYVPNSAAENATSSDKLVTGTTVDSKIESAIGALEAPLSTLTASETLKSIREDDGIISVETQKIQIDKSQVNELNSDLSEINTKLSTLAEISADHDGRIEDLEGQMDIVVDGLDGLSGRMDAAEATLEEHTAVIDAVSTDYLKASVFNALSNGIGLSAASKANPVATYDDIKDIVSHGINIRGEVDEDVNDKSPTYKPTTGTAGEYYKDVAPKSGDLIVNQKDTSEYLYVGEFGEGKNGHFIRIGDETRYALKTITVNGYALSSDITLNATDIKVSDSDDRTISAAIGDLSFAISAEARRATGVEDEISGKAERKVWVQNPSSPEYADGKYSDLSVVKIQEDEFMTKVVNETLFDGNVLYVISADHFNAYGQKIINVASSDVSSDVANVQYVNAQIISISSTVSDEYLTQSAFSSLSDDIGLSAASRANPVATHEELSGYVALSDLSNALSVLSADVIDSVEIEDIATALFNIKTIIQDKLR